MPLITQGKTNWKFLLIVVVLAAVVGGGIWWCMGQQKEPTQLLEIDKPGQVALNYKNTLSQMFPDKEFSEVQERGDCFQDKEKIFYCIEGVNRDFLVGPNQKNILIVVREGSGLAKGEQPYYPHAEGLYHAWLAVFETKTNKILTNPFRVGGDSGEINFYNCKNKTFISFAWTVGGQGLLYGGIRLLSFENNNLEEIWSWKNDVGTLVIQEGNKIAVYQMQPLPSDFECADKCLYENYPEEGEARWAYLYSYDFKWDDDMCGFREDETTDWQTYKNEEYGFEAKYPKDERVSYEGKTEYILQPLKVDFRYFRIIIWENSQKLAIKDYFLKESSCVQNKSICEYLNQGYSFETIKIGEVEGFTTSIGVKSRVLVATADERYIIEFLNLWPTDEEKTEIFNQILSTFRFTEEKKEVTVTSPTEEEVWGKGEDYQIQWTPNDPSGVIGEIRLYKFPYLSLDLVWTSGNIPNTGNYLFTVPEWLEPGKYRFSWYKAKSDEFLIVE